MIYTILYTTLILAILTAIVLWLVRKSKESVDLYEKRVRKISEIISMPSERAKLLALKYIQDERMFRCVADPIDDNFPFKLPQSVYELLQHYSSIESVRGETKISRADIGVWYMDPRFTKIGSDVEHIDILCCGQDERIYDFDGTEEGEEEKSTSLFPNIYYYIVNTSAALYGEYIYDTDGKFVE